MESLTENPIGDLGSLFKYLYYYSFIYLFYYYYYFEQWTCPQGMTYRSSSAPALGFDHGFIRSR